MLRHTTIKTRLIAAFTVLVVLFLAVSLYMLGQMGTIDSHVDRIHEETDQVALTDDIDSVVLERNRLILWALAADSPETTETVLEMDAEMAQQMDTAIAALEELVDTEGGKAVMADLKGSIAAQEELWTEQHELLAAGKGDEAVALLNSQGVEVVEQATAATTAAEEYFAGTAAEAFTAANAGYEATSRNTFIVIAAVALIAAAIAFLVYRSVSRAVIASAVSVTGSSEELASVSSQLGAAAEETAAQASVVAAAGEQVSHNVATVATAVEEMNASVREIASNASDAASVANSAVAKAEATNATVAKLGDASAEISKVIEVITSIAEQTNLLALNATIEAARAGEAGKGFAVVANEVKELAKETAKATEEIGSKIAAIQAETNGAVESIGEISSVIGQIADLQTTIASAVEEQTATTSEIARNVNEAARGSAEIAENITSVATAAQETSAGAQTAQSAARVLAEVAGDLQALVGRTKGGDTTAPPAAGEAVPAPVPA